jgi:hypothetical protein
VPKSVEDLPRASGKLDDAAFRKVILSLLPVAGGR